MMFEDEEEIRINDNTPTIAEQARLNGWKGEMFNFGTRENEAGIDLFNPGLVRRPDGLWLIVRRSENHEGLFFGKNALWACELRDRKPHGGPLLAYPDSDNSQQFEDARAFMWNNQVWISACNFTWYSEGNWTGAHQVVLVYKEDAEWTPIARKDPPVGKNREVAGDTFGRHEKNWVFFVHQNKLNLLYQANPWLVVEFGQSWDEQKTYQGPSVTWAHGEIRGGTPPIQVGDLYWTFFHSSVPWIGRYRRYVMGALAFEAKPPFRPVRLTQEPLLSGSQNDFWKPQKPLVIFPCGAVFEDSKFFIVYGINDLRCGWVEMPMEDVEKLATPIIDPTSSLIADDSAKALNASAVALTEVVANISPDEARKIKLRENMAKARAVRAANIALRKQRQNGPIVDAK